MTAHAILAAGHSRRSFLMAGAGSVAAGAGALTGGVAVVGALAGAGGAATQDGPLDELVGSVVAYVSDVAAGEITLMVDDRETVVTDAQLARTLARLAG